MEVSNTNDRQERVVITGLGTVNPLGNTVEAYWDGLVSGRSGIDKIDSFDVSDMPCQIGGELKDFDPLDYMDKKEARRSPRVTQMILAATNQLMHGSQYLESLEQQGKLTIIGAEYSLQTGYVTFFD